MLEIVKSPVDEAKGLVDRAGALHAEISEKTEELRGLKAKLASLAEFKPGSKTGHIYGNHFAATVQLSETLKWDQKKLGALRVTMGDEEFFKVFQWKYEPVSKKLVDGALEFGKFGGAIKEALTVVAGSPQATFKIME
jgi:hypothetical protein